MAGSTTTTTTTITYEHPGTTPPIFVAGSFTTPLWQPIELDQRQANGEYVFSKAFDVAPGTHQYKFRIGYGDWWVCDDTKATETDAAGNVNNIITVQSSVSNDLGQPAERPIECDQGADTSSNTASDHRNSPSLGLDGVNGSNAECARSLRKETVPTDKTVADFHDANGNIGPDDTELEMASREDPGLDEALDSPTNGSGTTAQQVHPGNDHKARDSHARDSDSVSKSSAGTSHGPDHKETNLQHGEVEIVPHKSSVATVPVTSGQEDQKDFGLIGVCRTVVQGVVGSMSTLLCGKHRKHLAVALTVLMIPILAWTWRS